MTVFPPERWANGHKSWKGPPGGSQRARRSASLRPPQIPWGSRMRRAYDRHALRTSHCAQIAFAWRSRAARASLRSKWGGAKNMVAGCPRQAALACQSSLVCSATVTFLPPLARVASTQLADNRQKGGTTRARHGSLPGRARASGALDLVPPACVASRAEGRGTCRDLGLGTFVPPACDAPKLQARRSACGGAKSARPLACP
jgi:hypothetical protein